MMNSPSLRTPHGSLNAPALIKRLHSLADIEAERCKRSLAYYIPRAWKIVEPVTPSVTGKTMPMCPGAAV